jgi:putative tryptophan/tyrosine transport system substrate-binding protein
MIRRRVLVVSALAAVARAPARAQSVPVIGYLGGRSLATDAHLLQAVKDGLKENGFVEGRNVRFEFRWADGDFSRLDRLAQELVALKPDLLMAVGGTPVPIAMKRATSTIPIVFGIGFDPVVLKLVDSLARPGGNATGAMLVAAALEGKRIELLKEMQPDLRSVALLVNSTSPMIDQLAGDAGRAATAFGVTLHLAKVATVPELDAALADLAARRPGGLAVTIDGFLIAERRRIIAWAARERVPAIYPAREFTDDGGLASYAARWAEAYHWIGVYGARILKGAKPADLPIQQPTAYELVINLKTARAQGLTLPAAFTARADEVIE